MDFDSNLIFDWNNYGPLKYNTKRSVRLNDESLRDGLQSPSTVDPPFYQKQQLVNLMEELQIDALDLGYPAANKKIYNDVVRLSEHIRDNGLKIEPNCAARTDPRDIQPIIEISQTTGVPIEIATFIGSSPIRMAVQKWKIEDLLRLTENSINLCTKNDIPSMYVTEDTTRAKPEVFSALYLRAVELGARAICISDTVGYISPKGAFNLVSYIKQLLADDGYKDVRIDWHGHQDRGLGVINALAAIEAGADQVHGTGLGIGERCGNTPLDTLLVNLKLMKYPDFENRDLHKLAEYVKFVSSIVEIPIPSNYPVFGKDAFRTATGVHAAAIIKAKEMGSDVADNIYSGVPARDFGKQQQIDIGPLSGTSNVVYVLKSMGYKVTNEKIELLLNFAKKHKKVLSRDDIRRIIDNS